MLRIGDDRALQAAALALKGMDRDLRNSINRATTQHLGPVWKQEVNSRASSTMDRRVLAKGARMAGGNPPVLFAATSRRRMSGGLVPAESARAFEFGSSSRNVKRPVRTRSRTGTPYTAQRRTQRQLPPRHPSGRVVYPAFAEVAPRLAALWTQLAVRKTFDAIEGR